MTVVGETKRVPNHRASTYFKTRRQSSTAATTYPFRWFSTFNALATLDGLKMSRPVFAEGGVAQ